MRIVTVALLGVGLVLSGHGLDGVSAPQSVDVDGPAVLAAGLVTASEVAPEDLTAVVRRTCTACHNDGLLTGGLSLQDFDVERAPELAETAEKIIVKLRAGMMPPPGIPRPGGDTLQMLVETLEQLIDEAAAEDPNPGDRTFQRLNRTEYEASIQDLLDLQVDAGDYLPLDTKSANFDNIADVQTLSPTLLDAYLRAAAEISRLAVGYPDARASEKQYPIPRWESQVTRVPGAPIGTRGGTSVMHNFPADGEYFFRVAFHHETMGNIVGNQRSALNSAEDLEQIEISIDGQRVALIPVDPWMHISDREGVERRSPNVFVPAGPHRVTAAFLNRLHGPTQDLVSPHDWTLTSTNMANAYGFLQLPHLRDMVVAGPYNTKGVSETPSRRSIFSCRPLAPSEEPACAREIVSRLATDAFRRPVESDELEGLMSIYRMSAEDGGFEIGIRTALEAILAMPNFVFRFERPAAGVAEGETYALRGLDLASRLSFFLWGAPPDAELLELAHEGSLSDPDVLEAQVDRMIADARVEALGSRFAAQWLRLQDLDKINPDVREYPDYHWRLRTAMRLETETFFNNLVKEDRSMLELFTADYTFLNETLADHYGIPGVVGDELRIVEYPDARRRGIFGHGSILTLTSLAGRTSPVLRGKWVMEVIIGTPPPPPPPGVPDLEATEDSDGTRQLTTRERMEKHRSNLICAGCHKFMDPIGLSLDNFDVTGRWRIREFGMPLDTRGELYDGTPVTSPSDLVNALMGRPIPLVRNFTTNLFTYALGRRAEYYDQPTIRAISAQGEADGYRISSFIHGVVQSDAFRMKRAVDVAAEEAMGAQR